MASNTNELKRLEVKYVRDKAKNLYPKGEYCEICGTSDELELHHYRSLSLVWEDWKRNTGVVINSVDDIMFHRETFISEHDKDLYADVVTLCAAHHKKLHSLYGAKPALVTADKQKRWVGIQKDKLAKG